MIDLHNHILPGMDDGAENMEQALEMAELAKVCGTSVIAATPHCNVPGMPKNEYDDIYREKLGKLQQLLNDRQIGLTVVPGMEIFGTEDAAEKLKAGRLITLNHTQYPLVEFDFGEKEDFMFLVIEKLIRAGYTPVLAHPERYYCVQRNLQNIYEWYLMGVVIQVNKGSVLGRFGRRAEITAAAILNHRLAAIAASDAHGADFRTPDMSEFRKILDFEYGDGCSPLLLEENPKRILEGKEIFWESPIPFE